MKYNHLSIEERETIQEMLWQRLPVRSIAARLGRNPSSISREINKNRDSANRRHYTPRTAHEKALKNRSSRGRANRLKNETLRSYTVSQLKLGWSPEQIAATALRAVGVSVSHEAIYQYIYAQIHRGGYGLVKPGCEDLRPFLARRRKRRSACGRRHSFRVDKGPLPSIEMRPLKVQAREEAGHWEDDLIVSRSSRFALKTINERASGVVFIEKVADSTAKETHRAVVARLSAVPEKLRLTLTRDRGSENLGYEDLENRLNLSCYFAHAYHSWERGSNENLNGLIRRFLPKKTDFRTVTAEQIRMIEHLLNSRPRKRLAWKTPYEVFYELTGVALQS